jgi:hypothetical protein
MLLIRTTVGLVLFVQRLGGQGNDGLVSSRGKASFYKAPRQGCSQSGLLFDWKLWSLPGFKATEVMKLRTQAAVLKHRNQADLIISTLPSLSARVPYIYFIMKYSH